MAHSARLLSIENHFSIQGIGDQPLPEEHVQPRHSQELPSLSHLLPPDCCLVALPRSGGDGLGRDAHHGAESMTLTCTGHEVWWETGAVLLNEEGKGMGAGTAG